MKDWVGNKIQNIVTGRSIHDPIHEGYRQIRNYFIAVNFVGKLPYKGFHVELEAKTDSDISVFKI